MKRHRIVLLVIACSIGLAGCDSSSPNAPATTPTATQASKSPSASPSSEPATTTSNAPTTAQGQPYSLAGAVTFTTNFLNTLNSLYIKPSGQTLPPLVTSACETCSRLQSDFAKWAADGTHYSGQMVKIDSVTPVALGNNDAQVIAAVTQYEVSRLNAQGQVEDRVKPGNFTFSFRLAYEDNSWKVTSLKAAG